MILESSLDLFWQFLIGFFFQILEFVRDGEKTVAELMDLGKQFLGRYYHQTSFLVAFFFLGPFKEVLFMWDCKCELV